MVGGSVEAAGAGFKYRGIDDVMNSLHEAFAEHGVFITTEVLDRKEVERQSKSGGTLFYVTITVRFTFNASDGSYISSTIYGTAMDSGDKADNKCMSIALKYCLLQAFLIPTEDMAEPDSQTHEVKPMTKPAPAPAPTNGKLPMTAQIWEKTVARMKVGEQIADKVRKAYTLTPDLEKQLNELEKKQEVPSLDALLGAPVDLDQIINNNLPSQKPVTAPKIF